MNRIITTKDVLDRLLELSATYPYATFDRASNIDVCFYDEQGMTDNVEFYPVKTDTTNWENDEDEVLKQIISDHPAGEWQNNEW